MSRMPNWVEIDATVIDTDGVVVPRDIDNDDVVDVPDGYDFAEIDAYQIGDAHVKHDWAIKIVNDADESIDTQPLASTSDDGAFESAAEDGSNETVGPGDPPENVELIHSETVAQYVGIELSADPVPTTGTVTVVFNSRRYG